MKRKVFMTLLTTALVFSSAGSICAEDLAQEDGITAIEANDDFAGEDQELPKMTGSDDLDSSEISESTPDIWNEEDHTGSTPDIWNEWEHELKLSMNGYGFTKKWQKVRVKVLSMPEGVKESDIRWSSSDDRIARVTQNGTVIAVNGGDAVITAYVNDQVSAEFDASVQGVKPDKAELRKVQSWGYSALKLTWNQTYKAHGYRIYRADSENGTYQFLKQISDGSMTSYVDRGLTTGKRYYYKIRAFRRYSKIETATPDTDYVPVEDSYPTFGSMSESKSAVPVPQQVRISGEKDGMLTWNRVSGASGYRIYYKNSLGGSWNYLKQINSGSTISYKINDAAGTTERNRYYRMRAYRTVNGKKIFGAYSPDIQCGGVMIVP